MASNFEDVQAFHDKFGLGQLRPERPSWPTLELLQFRYQFMAEELDEFWKAGLDPMKGVDLALAADALVDLVYVALGTADMMGLPWQALWAEVQRANMSKVRAIRIEDSLRRSTFDVVKPPGWTPPDIQGILDAHHQEQDPR